MPCKKMFNQWQAHGQDHGASCLKYEAFSNFELEVKLDVSFS